MESMTERGFSRYEGKSGGHWTFEPRLIDPRTDAEGKLLPLPHFRQVQLGIAVADRARRCLDLAARPHCSEARRKKLRRRAAAAQRMLQGLPA
jgi:hypothetical protein